MVLTPTDQTDANQLEKADHFWRLTGGMTKQMSPLEHDAHLAAVSHVPHLVSALVARMAEPESRPLVGSGWQDITRVAAGDPTLWTAICQENRAAIGQQLEKFSGELDRLRQLIEGEEDDDVEVLAGRSETCERTDQVSRAGKHAALANRYLSR